MTKSSFLQDLHEDTRQHLSANKGSARRFVICNRDNLNQAIKQGYTLKSLWEHLSRKGLVVCTYQRFCNAVQRYLPETPLAPERLPEPANQTTLAQKGRPGPIKVDAPKLISFKWNPNPKKEDLE